MCIDFFCIDIDLCKNWLFYCWVDLLAVYLTAALPPASH